MDHYDALIVSHGQPSAPDPAEAALAAFTARVQAQIPDIHLGAATLAAPGALEDALTRVRPGAPIYPMFMSDGWFVKTNLARRLGDAPVSVMVPLGLECTLPRLVAAALTGDHLLLAAHGSAAGRPAPERATRDFAKALEAARPGLSVNIGFLEQAPHISDQIGDATSCLPFFAMEGDHVRADLPEELSKGGYTGPVLPVISDIEGVDAMVASSISYSCTTRQAG